MPLSYSKWDNLDDSDEEEAKPTTSASTSSPDRDPAMDQFLSLGRDASVAQIQEKIKGMSAETRESLLRHEKGGLLKRVLELDPNKSYEAGEIFGTAPPVAATNSAPAPAAAKKAPALKPTPKPKAAPPKPSEPPPKAPSPPPKHVSPPKQMTHADDDDDEPRFEDITDEIAASQTQAQPLTTPSSPAPASVSAPAPAPPLAHPPASAPAPASAPTAGEPTSADIKSILGLDDQNPTPTAITPSLGGGHKSFTFVRLPADVNLPIEAQTGFDLPGGDTLPMLLAPVFKSDLKFDEDTFKAHMEAAVEQAQQTAAKQTKNANGLVDGAEGPVKPSMHDLEMHSMRGVCEAWPLASASYENGWMAVKLYIDEVGALRKRPRNARAEAIATATGQLGLAIHGDAYVGRLHLGATFGEENNVDFSVDELAAHSPWLVAARTLRESEKERRGYDANAQIDKKSAATPTYTSGGDAQGGDRYAWSQDDESVEVRVLKGVPTGANAKHRVKVSYGSGGEELKVCVDGQPLLELAPLFARVQPFECSWSLDGAELVVNLEKCDAKPWLDLIVPTEQPTGNKPPPKPKEVRGHKEVPGKPGQPAARMRVLKDAADGGDVPYYAPSAPTPSGALPSGIASQGVYTAPPPKVEAPPVAEAATLEYGGKAPADQCDACKPDRAESAGTPRRHKH